jgi:hypothetical protein
VTARAPDPGRHQRDHAGDRCPSPAHRRGTAMKDWRTQERGLEGEVRWPHRRGHPEQPAGAYLDCAQPVGAARPGSGAQRRPRDLRAGDHR